MYLPQWKVHAKVASVNDTTPTPEQARAAIAEAKGRAVGVRRSDSQLRFVLLAIAATYVAIGVVVGRFPHGGHLAGPTVLAIYGAGVAMAVVIFWRVRAYSKPGILRFTLWCAGFTIWNSAVIGASLASGWFGPNIAGWHFTVSAAVAATPLVAAAWLLAPPRR
jgi:hypothetical protein